VYRIATQSIVIESRTMVRGDLVKAEDLAGLASYFLNLGLIEATVESAQITPPKSALAQALRRFMTPTSHA
jgi:hypothetical protein